MKTLAMTSVLIAAAILLTQSTANAQFGEGGPGSIGGVGGLSGGGPGPRMGGGGRRLTRSRSPALSPYLYMLPEATDTFEGQFLMHTVPLQQFYNNVQSNDRTQRFQQGEINTNSTRLGGLSSELQEVRTGVAATGKRVQFMNTGSYFPNRGGGR